MLFILSGNTSGIPIDYVGTGVDVLTVEEILEKIDGAV